MRETAWEDLLGLSWLHSRMLRERMRVCSRCRLEGHGAERTFKEHLTVSTLDVGFYSCHISEDHTAVDTAGRRRKTDLNKILTEWKSVYFIQKTPVGIMFFLIYLIGSVSAAKRCVCTHYHSGMGEKNTGATLRPGCSDGALAKYCPGNLFCTKGDEFWHWIG